MQAYILCTRLQHRSYARLVFIFYQIILYQIFYLHDMYLYMYTIHCICKVITRKTQTVQSAKFLLFVINVQRFSLLYRTITSEICGKIQTYNPFIFVLIIHCIKPIFKCYHNIQQYLNENLTFKHTFWSYHLDPNHLQYYRVSTLVSESIMVLHCFFAKYLLMRKLKEFQFLWLIGAFLKTHFKR